MYYLCKGDDSVGYSVIGVVVDGELLSIKKLINENIDVLKNMDMAYYAYVGNMIDICIEDNDDLFPLGSVMDAINVKMQNRVISSLIPMNGTDSDEAAKFKMSIAGFLSKNLTPDTGVTIEQFNRAVLDRLDFEKENENSGLFIDKVSLLKLPNLLDKTSDKIKEYIDQFIEDHPASCTNSVMMNEEQQVIFYATNDGVMPKYDEVAGIDENTVDMFRMRYLVPAYHRYIGGYVNYTKGSPGSEFSVYDDRDYITRGVCAAIMNDIHYRKVLKDETAASILNCVVGGNRVRITRDYIEGSDEYDTDGIRENEREYYDALCKFIDICQEEDILKSTVSSWYNVGLDLTKYVPGITQKEVSLRQYDRNAMIVIGTDPLIDNEFGELTTEELKKNKETERRNDEKLNKYGLNREDLNKKGLTREQLASVTGSPTSLKWFRYAINVALAATRAYTGKVEIPYGYDAADFMRFLNVNRVSFDDKYSRLISDNVLFTSAGAMQLLDVEDERLAALYSGSGVHAYTPISDSDDVAERELDVDSYFKQHSLCSDSMKSSRYPVGKSGRVDITPEYIRDTERESVTNEDVRSMSEAATESLTDIIITNCIACKSRYAFAEALIKCLRFGNNKPRNLCISGTNSKINLTTGEIIENINYDKPVLRDDKKYVMRYAIVSNGLSKDAVEFLKAGTKCGKSNKIIIGVGLGEYYEKSTPGEANEIITFYDMEVFTRKTELHNNIFGYSNGVIDTSSRLFEEITVERMLDLVNNNTVRYHIEMNDSIFENIIKRFLDGIENTSAIAYQKISKMNKDGYGLFDMFSILSGISGISTAKRYVIKDVVIKGLIAAKGQSDLREIMNMVVLDTFRLYGEVIAKCYSINTEDIGSLFEEEFNIWNTMVDYSMKLSDGDRAVSDEFEQYKAVLTEKLGSDKFNVMYLIDVEKKNGVDTKVPIFYMLQNKESKYGNKYVIMSCDLYKDSDVREYNMADKVSMVNITQFMMKIKKTAAQNNMDFVFVQEKLTVFIDDKSANRFNNIARRYANA